MFNGSAAHAFEVRHSGDSETDQSGSTDGLPTHIQNFTPPLLATTM
ncbi:hypothetical protein EGR_04278 [Echinococcus granulosus]|uniref:Uncharacterized protein n=1 Tax=Echinococcus granulosus TaxID=6210 RepID=W6V428_ECHGR|nr:hypothetical protein EGR_04278 [Echinococcus granulosus]EUB60839.1 hypothetical protein EGR_04278 [Echinococcus granulosus]